MRYPLPHAPRDVPHRCPHCTADQPAPASLGARWWLAYTCERCGARWWRGWTRLRAAPAATAAPRPRGTVRDMGMFDTVHGGDRCGQTKALGKNLASFVPGDSGVRLIPAPLDEESFERYLADQIEPVADTFQIRMHDGGGYVVVRDTVYVGWYDHPEPDLRIFDGVGRPLTTEEAAHLDADAKLPRLPSRTRADELLDAVFGPDDAGDVPEHERCVLCTAIRTDGPDAARQQREDLVAERRARIARMRIRRNSAGA